MTRIRPIALERDDPSPAVARLRRLRLSLTALFTVAMAIGFLALALLVLHKDSEARLNSLEATMGRRVTGSSRLIYYSNRGRLRLDGLREDDLTTGTPEIRVFDGVGNRPRPIFTSSGAHLPIAYRDFAAVAARAAGEEATVADTITDRAGQQVRLLAGPFFKDPNGNAAGAVVSAASLGPDESAHRELTLTVAIGCAALLVGAAGAGYFLAGRSLKPAAQSLAQQEALLADAAHELRTPVASIRALMEAAQLDPETTDAAIGAARVESVRMGDTLSALLALARMKAGTEPPNATPLRLDQLVEDTVAEVAGDGEVGLVTSPTVVRGDPALLRIAVRNLVDNGLRHGQAPGGSVPIEVRVEGESVSVADRGEGFSGDLLRDGAPRFRSGSATGTGLGLAIAARIAELHGASLSVSGREGGGSVVRLDLGPAVEGSRWRRPHRGR